MTIPSMSGAPAAPQRNDSDTFDATMQTFVDWLPGFRNELQAVITAMNALVAYPPAGYVESASAAEILAASVTSKVLNPAGAKAIHPHGECYFRLVGGVPTLERVGFGRVTVNGKTIQLPTAGVTNTSGSIGASVLRYFYLDDTGALILSATGYVLSGGVPVKSDDATKTLVGMARTNGAGTWELSASYYNRRLTVLSAPYTTTRSTASATAQEISSNERVGFLSWGDGWSCTLLANLDFYCTAAATTETVARLDGSTDIEGSYMRVGVVSAEVNTPRGKQIAAAFAEPAHGYHYVSLFGNTTAGSLTIVGGATAGKRSSLALALYI